MLSRTPSYAAAVLGLGAHLGVALLLLVIVVQSLVGDPSPRVVAAALAMTAVYALGALPRIRTSPRRARLWGAALTVCWAVLVWTTPLGIWIAFPLFFLALHLLERATGLLVVAVITVVAICGFAWHTGEWAVGGVLGPIFGAVVAVGTSLALQTSARLGAQRGVLAERDRLAREIHDTLAQGLNSIHLLLQAAEPRIETDPARARELVAQARTTAETNLENARRVVRDLTPAELTEGSLATALAALCDEQDAPPTSFRREGEAYGLPPATDLALLRVAQEALTNVRRHAGAQRAVVTLTYQDSEVRLDVVDDGSGLPADHVPGFGIRGMTRRIAAVDGQLRVESGTHGTAVVARIPVTAR